MWFGGQGWDAGYGYNAPADIVSQYGGASSVDIFNNNNVPTYQILNQVSWRVTPQVNLQQLSDCSPICLFPFAWQLPNQQVAIVAGNLFYVYNYNPATLTITRDTSWNIPNFPVPVSYPLTATATMLELSSANNYVPTVSQSALLPKLHGCKHWD